MQKRAVEEMKNAIDSYKCIGVSTGHLSESDKMLLNQWVFRTNMCFGRNTGWFIKLYEIDGEDAENTNIWEDRYPEITNNLKRILSSAYDAGYRMIEFDADASQYDCLDEYF